MRKWCFGVFLLFVFAFSLMTWTTQATITYYVENNTIVVSDGQYTLLDIYNADKNGILNIVETRTVTSPDPDPIPVDRPLRPTDEVVLGGAKNDLGLICSALNSPAVVRIYGIDAGGENLTEDINVTAKGIYYFTNYYKNITATQVLDGSLRYRVAQGQWGVVWHPNPNHYHFDAKIVLRNATLIDERKLITLGEIDAFKIEASSWLNLTESQIIHTTTEQDTNALLWLVGNGSAKFDDCILIGNETWIEFENYEGKMILQNTTLINLEEMIVGSSKNIPAIDGSFRWSGEVHFASKGNISSGEIISSDVGVDFSYASENITIRNLKIQALSYDLRAIDTTAEEIRFVDCYAGEWDYYFYECPTLFKQCYTFNLKVTDKEGNAIEDAEVIIRDKDGNVVFDDFTDGNGEVTTEITYAEFSESKGRILKSPHTLIVSKDSYEEYTTIFTANRTITWSIALTEEKTPETIVLMSEERRGKTESARDEGIVLGLLLGIGFAAPIILLYMNSRR
ncbi:MAG: hypothetical protein ACTSVR_10360 [Candidatus Thorarchaeota archaeon]